MHVNRIDLSLLRDDDMSELKHKINSVKDSNAVMISRKFMKINSSFFTIAQS